MFDPTHLVEHWGYAAILAIEILGNLGIPLPEEEPSSSRAISSGLEDFGFL